MKAVILESYVMEKGDLDWSGVKALVPDTTSYVRTDYESVGRGFESLPSHQTMKIRTFSR